MSSPDIQQMAMFRQKDVEKLFAACVFVNPIETIQQCGWLRPEIILNEQVRRFWSAARERITPDMDGTDRPTELVLQIGMETGLQSELMSWMQDVTYSHLPLPYANEISRRAYITGISSQFGELVQSIAKGDDQEARRIIRAMNATDTSGSLYIPTAHDVAEKFARIVRSGQRSVQTFIPPIDAATGGMERQALTVLAGRTSTGKTAMAWQIAQQVAYSGKTVLFFSLEMSDASVWARSACPKVGVVWRDVLAHKITAEQEERLLEESYALKLQFGDNLRMAETSQSTDTMWQAVAQVRPDLVVVDHMRLAKDTHPAGENKRMGMISERLKDIARNFDCAVLVLAQLNRQGEYRQDKRPILADLRDSGEIEETGDLILMLYSESGPGFERSRIPSELWVRKFRNGPRDVLVNLIFNARDEWFEAKER